MDRRRHEGLAQRGCEENEPTEPEMRLHLDVVTHA